MKFKFYHIWKKMNTCIILMDKIKIQDINIYDCFTVALKRE